jgi:hypothetical protein
MRPRTPPRTFARRAAALPLSLAASSVLALLAAPGAAFGQDDVDFRFTETFITEYVGDNGPTNEGAYGDDDDFWIFRNLFYAQAGNKEFDSGLRLDVDLFQGPPGHVDSDAFYWGEGAGGYTTLDYGNDLRLERIYGTAHIDRLNVTVGDFYVSFGRGIALSLVKLDDVGEDTALRGARLEYHVPRGVKVVLVGGAVNALNVDPITKQVFADDPLDKIAGARVEWEIADALSLGVHGVLMRPRFTDADEVSPDRLFVDQGPGVAAAGGGASAELHAGGFQLYLEGNAQSHDNYRPAEAVMDESGYAVFGETSYDLSPFLIKVEGIFYRRWLMEGPYRGSYSTTSGNPAIQYNNMPTLEPVWMTMNSRGNAEGGRLSGDLFIRRSETQLTLCAATLFYEGGLQPMGVWSDHPPTLVVHPILKVRQAFGGSGVNATAEGGFRYETTDEPLPGHEDNGRLWHASLDLSVPIKGPHSVEGKVEIRRHDLHVSESVPHWVTLESLGYDMSGVFGITLVHEYSDETAGADLKLGEWELPLPRQHYVWAMVSAHLPKPLDGLTLRLLAGAQRGGIKCAGGVCRLYPDSVGARLEAIYRF